jgi:hypothetical protein
MVMNNNFFWTFTVVGFEDLVPIYTLRSVLIC